jgi:hypothetical protein
MKIFENMSYFLKNGLITFFYLGMDLPWDGIDDL